MRSRRTKTILMRSLAMLTLVAVLAGCEITAKTASPDPVTKGEQLTFTIEVAFEPEEQNALVEDHLPDSVQFVSAQVDPLGSCRPPVVDNVVTCGVENPDFPDAGTATITIVVIPIECGTFTNTAVIPFIPLAAEQQATLDQLSAEQLAAEQLSLEQLPTEDLVTAQQIDEESVDFTVVGCEQPEPESQPKPEPQQPAGAAPVTQESDQESESGEIDQSFEVS